VRALTPPPLGTTIAGRLDGLAAWKRHVVAVAAGAIATLAHAPFHIYPAFVVGMVVLVWLLDGAHRRPDRNRAAFARAWSFAFGYFVTGFYWVGFAFLAVEGGAPLIPLAISALPAAMAVYWGLAAIACMPLWSADARRIPVLATALTATEWVRGHLFGGFPWHLPGSIWIAGEPISQSAAWFGVYGLTAVTLLVAASPAVLADGRGSAGARAAPMLAAALLLGLIWGAGAQRLARNPPEADRRGPVIRVADAGYSQTEKWAPGAVWRVFDDYLGLIGDERSSSATINIWPEGAIPAPVLEVPEMLTRIGAKLGDRVLVIGVSRWTGTQEEPVAYNSAVVLDGVSGVVRVGQIYDKHHLVPFGEYIPFWDLVSDVPLAPLQRIGQGFTSGNPPERMVIPGAPPAAILICYEAIFPGYAPRGVDRPEWLINISVDAWYGRQTGPWQHFNQASFRAIEEGLPLARSASGGVSAIVDPFGRALVKTGLEGGAVETSLPGSLPAPLYARYGDLLVLALLALVLGLRFAPPWAPGRGLGS
jgi:apolipoprotein N-acyltransferase